MTRTYEITCRLCGGKSQHLFDKQLLERHDVAYYQCQSCGSQQTEEPHWLDEAYDIPGVHIDVGSASRTMKNWLGASSLLDQLGFDPKAKAVDFGSGIGLFARLMRDVGYNFSSYDKYTTPRLTNYFLSDDLKKAKIITAFEVFEHLPNPAETLTQLFSADADLLFFTTWFCDDQDEDWIYYLPECGQHVFFYKEEAMRSFAGRFGYEMTASHFFFILAKPDRLTDDQKQTIERFSLTSMDQIMSGLQSRIGGTLMGNEHIDADLAHARNRFASERRNEGTNHR